MAANTNPIFSAYGDIQGGDLIGVSVPGTPSLVTDYTGQGLNHASIFHADQTNGGFIQRIRFKSNGANAVASVARIYYNNNNSRILGQASAPGGTPTGSISASGGSLQTGTGITYFAKIVSVDQYGGKSAPSTETGPINSATTGSAGSINWSWTAAIGAVSYLIYVGPQAGGQLTYFTSPTNSFLQLTAVGTRESLSTSVNNNNALIGEISLPIVAASQTAATVDIDYTLNMALPPGGRILVGISTTGTTNNGWIVTGIGGEY
jgi:hypothetical protein